MTLQVTQARTQHMKCNYPMQNRAIDDKLAKASIQNTDVLSGKHVAVPSPYGDRMVKEAVAWAVLKRCVKGMDLSKRQPLRSMQPLVFQQAAGVVKLFGAQTAETLFLGLAESRSLNKAHQALATMIALRVRDLTNCPEKPNTIDLCGDPNETKNEDRTAEEMSQQIPVDDSGNNDVVIMEPTKPDVIDLCGEEQDAKFPHPDGYEAKQDAPEWVKHISENWSLDEVSGKWLYTTP